MSDPAPCVRIPVPDNGTHPLHEPHLSGGGLYRRRVHSNHLEQCDFEPVFIDVFRIDTFRFDDIWNLDLRVAKNVRHRRLNAQLVADLFNVMNSNTVLNRQRNIASSAFNRITQNLSPRILRFGVRVGF